MNSSHPDSFSLHPYLNRLPWPSFSHSIAFQKRTQAQSLVKTWDRVAVLGDNRDYGHAGCVNALNWAQGGELLLTAGDDTTVQIWRMDSTDASQDYPFVCRTVIHTGHKANIFNCNMLPYSSRIVTVAGDREVRVFDVGRDHGATSVGQTRQEYCTQHAKTHTFKCHEDRVKRIASEESPDRFLTVSEDGTVRQHDLRTSHSCRRGCPAPLIQVRHELSTLATASYYCVVAGDSPYGYLFDRRFTGRDLQDEWGMRGEGLTTCVRRFGRANRRRSRDRHLYPGEHITGARMSSENEHEVLLSYSADGVYLFSTLDDPESSQSSSPSPTIVLPNSKRRKVSESGSSSSSASSPSSTEPDVMDIDNSEGTSEEDEGEDEGEEGPVEESRNYYPWVSTVHPRRRYSGARNVDTVKDVNFLGPRDEYVASGSDDGMFFVWHKSTGKLHGVYEGDGAVVNVIEGHPYLPLVAVSGIDHTVKLFAPVDRESTFSRLDAADSIMQRNSQRSNLRTIRTIRRLDFITLLASVRASSLGVDTEDESAELDSASDCVNQ